MVRHCLTTVTCNLGLSDICTQWSKNVNSYLRAPSNQGYNRQSTLEAQGNVTLLQIWPIWINCQLILKLEHLLKTYTGTIFTCLTFRAYMAGRLFRDKLKHTPMLSSKHFHRLKDNLLEKQSTPTRAGYKMCFVDTQYL